MSGIINYQSVLSTMLVSCLYSEAYMTILLLTQTKSNLSVQRIQKGNRKKYGNVTEFAIFQVIELENLKLLLTEVLRHTKFNFYYCKYHRDR